MDSFKSYYSSPPYSGLDYFNLNNIFINKQTAEDLRRWAIDSLYDKMWEETNKAYLEHEKQEFISRSIDKLMDNVNGTKE